MPGGPAVVQRSLTREILLVGAVAIAASAVAGCPSKSDSQSGGADTTAGDKGGANTAAADKSAKWLGTYEQQTKDKMVLVVKPDHKGSFAPAGQAGEMTWEVAGDDKITVNMGATMTMIRTSDGNLRDEEGATWKKTK